MKLEEGYQNTHISTSSYENCYREADKLPPSWKKDIAAAITAIMASVIPLSGISINRQHLYLVGTTSSGVATIYGLYETASAGIRYLQGDRNYTDLARVRRGIVVTSIAGVTFALFQAMPSIPST